MTRVGIVSGLLLVTMTTPRASAQQVIAPTDHLAFDRPEAWALEYFTSGTLLTAVDPPRSERAGSVGLQFEAGWLPTLSPAQERVGFAGTAAEDLNKAPVFVRPRVRIAIAPQLAFTIGGVPPVRAFGVTPRLVDVGVDWAFVDGPAWRLALRGHGQTGTVTGAFTCPDPVVAFSPGSTANPNGCTAASRDQAVLRYGAVELAIARSFRSRGLTPHVGVGVNGMNGVFQVNAQTFGNIDHTKLEMNGGATWSATTGASIRLASRFDASGEILFAPLQVRRAANGPATTDALLTVRATVTYWVRR